MDLLIHIKHNLSISWDLAQIWFWKNSPITFSQGCTFALLYEFCFLWFTNCVLLSDDNSLIPRCLWLLAFVLNNTLILGIFVFYNPSPPRMFLSLDLLSEYRIQHGAIGPLYVTSSYSTWIFCRGVSGFATDCPCDVWCRGLTTCLLHVGPPFGNRFLNTSWAVGLTYWIVSLNFFLYFDICNYICFDTSYHFLALSLLLKYSLFFQVLLY